jgi:hypothetical protein
MADFEREVTPAIETTSPPAPLHSNPAPFSFRAEGVRLTQSGDRLIVVSYVIRRVLTWMLCIMSLMFPLLWLPPFHFWTSLFHHATWRTMLSAVLATNTQLVVDELCVLSLAVMFYWLLVVGGDFNGVVLDQRSGTAKAAGRTRPLTDVEAVRVAATRMAGQPGPSGRRYVVGLLGVGEQKLSWWQKPLPDKGPKTSWLGIFPIETDADKFANAIAEFAGIPVQHQTWIK